MTSMGAETVACGIPSPRQGSGLRERGRPVPAAVNK
jgi:hypothetical protein